MIRLNSKKGLGAIVITSLLLLLIIIVIISMQNWYLTIETELFSDIGKKIETPVEINSVNNGEIYLTSEGNISLEYREVKIDGVPCNLSGSVSGLNIVSIDISSCLNYDGNRISTITLITNENIYAKSLNILGVPPPPVPTFTSVWNTALAGSANNQIALPLESSGTYDFVVTGPSLVGSPVNITSYTQNILNFTSVGIHEIQITGTIIGFSFHGVGDALKLLEIKEWGPLNLGNRGEYFYGCSNFDFTGDDILNLTGTINLYRIFKFANVFNGNISNWDTSEVTDMGQAFWGANAFNRNLTHWDTSSVIEMDYLFYSANSFNGNISNWNISNVITLKGTFWDADSFISDISSWDTSSVTNMDRTFYMNSVFNGNISNWNTSSVLTMYGMFWNADAFNSDISNWDTSSVTLMNIMFYKNTAFDGDITGWNVSSVTNMNSMFSGATSYANHNMSSWDVSGGPTHVDFIFNTGGGNTEPNWIS